MSLRITQSIMMQHTMRDVNANLKRIQDLQRNLSTGKDINKLSDDPIGVLRAVDIHANISQIGQHKTNIEDGKSRLSSTMRSLETVDQLLLDAQLLASDAVNDFSSASRPVIANEIDAILNQVLIAANSKFMGKYLFGGHESLTPPFTAQYDANGVITGVIRNVKGIDDLIQHTTAEGSNVPVNISGSAPFMPNGEGNTDDVFDSLIRMRDAIRNNNMGAAGNTILEVRAGMDNVLQQTSVAGERVVQMNKFNAQNDVKNADGLENLSHIIDTDFAKAISELNYQNFILQSSLQVGAKILSPTLLDFI